MNVQYGMFRSTLLFILHVEWSDIVSLVHSITLAIWSPLPHRLSVNFVNENENGRSRKYIRVVNKNRNENTCKNDSKMITKILKTKTRIESETKFVYTFTLTVSVCH